MYFRLLDKIYVSGGIIVLVLYQYFSKGERGVGWGGREWGVGGKPIDSWRYGRRIRGTPLTDTGTTLVITQGAPKNTCHLLLEGNIGELSLRLS